MIGYLADWIRWERAAEQAQAAHPDCTQRLDCPADDHLLDCRRFRRERRAAKHQEGNQ